MGKHVTVNATETLLTEEAVRDLEERTLSGIPNALARVIYLAALRDYSTGIYHHAGLSDRFGESTAAAAMERCHVKLYGELALRPIEELYNDLVSYLVVQSHQTELVIETWLSLRLFGILAPVRSNRILQEMFKSHLKCALRAVRCRPAPSAQTYSQAPLPPQ